MGPFALVCKFVMERDKETYVGVRTRVAEDGAVAGLRGRGTGQDVMWTREQGLPGTQRLHGNRKELPLPCNLTG